ncbi:Dam family site-specific DNA-(adenine-N6)-methyltransferase [Flocculibacter collagenilyticus]|uniref:Dam family site-specific DNA-(adenine-N6)-methyltransferase n=1 Tax=Flocculibacter collagenilyticus TaxID=2744479 RepID=UPI0018F36C72|nr:Dam family site-specific DNA-(adenine-N6)-methyltransferase [Flocculibacter collagenilyticus]
MIKKHRAFLKWAGGKYSLAEKINANLPKANKLVEPFVGAGSVFLNSDYERYLLNDINADLINLYNEVKFNAAEYINDARKLFVAKTNDRETYYALRQQFNDSVDVYERSLLFLYLNRHGYNGLCRYNRSGGFNVPFGDYKKPYFPEAELEYFAEKAQKATFICESYEAVFRRLRKGNVVYCDPPYVPLSKTASFTSYAKQGFNLDDQANLALLAEHACQRGITVLISNHDTTLTRKIYDKAELSTLKVGRSISQNGSTRTKVDELFALYR